MEEDRIKPNEFEYDQFAAADEIFSKEEIYFTSRENIEGFACIINSFIRQLSYPDDHTAVINVDNWDEELERQRGVKHGQLYFESSI